MVRRGAILLEAILSVALFTMGALAILSQMSQGARALEATQRARQAADLAATAMARIEARLVAPEALTGPAERWDREQQESLEESLNAAAPLGFDDFGAENSGWQLAVETEPAPFDGLTLVLVTATFQDPAPAAAPGASYTLRQLVRLGVGPRDEVGAEGDLLEAQERGARQQPRPSGFGAGNPAGGGP
jgi:hypothetical protein